MKLANKDKVLKDDRIFVLRLKDLEKPITAIGMVDKALFNGGNSLHARLDVQSGFWVCNYDHGQLPEALRGTWTSYHQLLVDVQAYLNKRNIEIVEVIA